VSPDCNAIVENIRLDVPQGLEDLYLLVNGMDRLFSYLISRVGMPEAEDGMHDILLQTVAAIRRDGLRDANSLPGMIRTIAKRWAITQIHLRVRFWDSASTGSEQIPAFCDVEGELLARERRAIVEAVLQRMSLRDREILTRFYLQEQPFRQICAELQLTETQFRLIKSRAKSRFGDLGRRMITTGSS
jgi:RNA polymerase sigma-70 factor (ECF subfamily)